MKSSTEMLQDLMVWSEKYAIDLEMWIKEIRMENLTTKGLEQGTNGRPSATLGSIEQLRKRVIAPDDIPLGVCQVG